MRRRIAAIDDDIHVGREKAYADAIYYAHIKEADSNDRLLTDNFLEYSRILRYVFVPAKQALFFCLARTAVETDSYRGKKQTGWEC